MKRILIVFTTVVGLLIAINVFAAMPSNSGGSGLIVTRTPDVLTQNSWNASLFLGYTGHLTPSDYGYPSGYSRDWADTNISGIFNYGFIKNLEGGIVFPVDINGGPKQESGIENINLLGKYKFLDGTTTPISLAGTLVIGIPSASKTAVLGSGDANVGIEADFGYRIRGNERNMLYWDIGFKQGDYYDKATPLKGYQSVPILLASLSYEYAILLEKAYFSVELIGQSANLGKASSSSSEIIPLGDEDFYGLLGIRYLPTRFTAISFGVGGGLPDPVRTDTNYLATIGFSYLFNRVSSAVKGFEYHKASLPPATKPSGITTGPKVVVVNGCAAGDKSQYFAQKIKSAGFNVIEVGRAPTLNYNDSVVIFNDPYYSQAVNILRLIPGSEKLAKSKVKSTAYDIYVVIGCSGVANAK
ncbi:MAG: LytR C-terminal domain-containing protein [bacterium]